MFLMFRYKYACNWEQDWLIGFLAFRLYDFMKRSPELMEYMNRYLRRPVELRHLVGDV